MKSLKCVASFALVMTLAACGGGGGNPGTSSGGTVASKDPVLVLAMQDASGTPTNSVNSSGFTVLKATLTDPSGNPIPNQVINVAADAVAVGETAKVVFPEGTTGLTNASGLALVKMARATLAATGAGSLTVTYSYKVGSITKFPDGSAPPSADKVFVKYIGYQLSAANITLTNMDVGASTLAAYGTRQVSVQANINGVPSIATPVQVNFSASCGQISPAVTSTNSAGVALVSYTATDATGTVLSTQGCSGKTVEISASTIGATVVAKSLNILAAPATNLSFISVKPARIFLADSGGITQAVVEFKLVNAREEPLLGQDVQLTMKTLNGGIPKASFGTVGNVSPIVVTTDSAGKVSVPVFSGTVPTNVLVNAALVSNPLVQTDSAVLAIASGRPAQARTSLALKEWAIEGGTVDGVSTDVTMSLADRQGNPVPDGTAVNFVTEGGVMIPPTCVTGLLPGDSQCSVKIRSQAPRPSNGRVLILAYAAGEEDFVDANFDNVHDCGESFTDLGTAYRDDNESGAFDLGEFSVPRSASASLCSASASPTPQFGDGVWGGADVRMPAVIVFATSASIISANFQDDIELAPRVEEVTGPPLVPAIPAVRGPAGIDVTVTDMNGNSPPTGSTISATAVDRTENALACALVGTASVKVSNSLGPALVSFGFQQCRSGDVINIKVTTPLGTITSKDFPLP